MLSMHDNEQFLFEAIRAGASGYVLKSSVDRDLVEACRAAMRGQPFLYPEGMQALMRETSNASHGDVQRRPADTARGRGPQLSRRRTPMTRSPRC